MFVLCGYKNSNFNKPFDQRERAFVEQFDGRIVIEHLVSSVSIAHVSDDDSEAMEYLSALNIPLFNPLTIKCEAFDFTPNDPLFGQQLTQYGDFSNKITKAYRDTTDAIITKKVAVCDTGIYPHPDLNNNRYVFTASNGERVAGAWVEYYKENGQDRFRVNEIGAPTVQNAIEDSRNYLSVPGDERTCHPHGTHVAGISGAEGNNSAGVAGLFYGAAAGAGLFSVRLSDSWDYKYKSPVFTMGHVIYAVDYCISKQFDVVNLSVGGYYPVTLDGGAFLNFLQQLFTGGISGDNPEASRTVFCIAAGNNSLPMYFYYGPILYMEVPGSVIAPNVIVVGAAATRSASPAFYTNYNTIYSSLMAYGGSASIDPSQNYLSTLPPNPIGYEGRDDFIIKLGGETYGYMSGTSMATPVITGAVASILTATETPRAQMPYVINTAPQMDIKSFMEGCCEYHGVAAFHMFRGGGIYSHRYGYLAAQAIKNGIYPPSITLVERVFTNTEALRLTIQKHPESLSNGFTITIGRNRFYSTYELDPLYSFTGEFSGDDFVLDIPLIDLGDGPDTDTLGISVFSFGVVPDCGAVFSPARKYRIPLNDACPNFAAILPPQQLNLFDWVYIPWKTYFPTPVTAETFNVIGDINALFRLLRMAHIALSKAHNWNYPVPGGLLSYASILHAQNPDDVFNVNNYRLREDITLQDVENCLYSLHLALQEFVDNGVPRYSSKFDKVLWFYPLDTFEFYSTGKIRRRPLPDSYRLGIEDFNRGNLKMVIYQIIQMLRMIGCMIAVPVTFMVKDLGIKFQVFDYRNINTDYIEATVPDLGGVVEVGSPNVYINGVHHPELRGEEEYIEYTVGNATFAKACMQGGPGLYFSAAASYFALEDTVDTWVSYIGSSNPVEFRKVKYVYLDALPERSDPIETDAGALLDTITQASGGGNPADYTPQNIIPTAGINDDEIDDLNGLTLLSKTDEDGTKRLFLGGALYNEQFPGPCPAHTKRIVLYKNRSSVIISSIYPSFNPPVRVSLKVYNSQLNAFFPQTLSYTLYYRIWRNAVGGELLVDNSIHLQLPKTNTYPPPPQQPYWVATHTLDYTQDTVEFVVESWIAEDEVDKNPKFTLTFLKNPQLTEYIPPGSDDIEDFGVNAKANFMQHVYAGSASWDRFDLSGPYDNPDPEIPLRYYGVFTYTRNCGISAHFVFYTTAGDYGIIPDLRGLPKDDAVGLCSYLGVSNDVTAMPAQFLTRVYDRESTLEEGVDTRPVIDQYPRPFTYISVDGDKPQIRLWVQDSAAPTVGETEHKNISMSAANRLAYLHVPSSRRVVYTIPDYKRFKISRQYPLFIENSMYSDTQNYGGYTVGGIIPTKDPALDGKTLYFPSGLDLPFITVGGLSENIPLHANSKVYGVLMYTANPISNHVPCVEGLKYTDAQAIATALGYNLRVVCGRLWYKTNRENPVIVRQFPAPGWPAFGFGNKNLFVMVGVSAADLRQGLIIL